MATHSSVLAWRIPGTGQPGGLLSMGFSRQENWTGLSYPPPGGRPDPEMEPASLTSSALAGETFTAKTIIYTQPNYNMLLMKCDLVSETVKCKP